ncbi:MAG: GNAT family N-acetyltransferase [Gemmatimonadaceae bacterium]|jgi:GNAT superfamily N-acetyltransferase|nr:GNAT family N-acetyltransferase [Gemmatimonadaceae bacterium]
MATLRTWRTETVAEHPERITAGDIPALNTVFSDAFSERYRKDGMVGVRVPHLNPLIWRYAIEGAGNGAMLWRTERGAIAAFNIAHRSGREGWMGPLAVLPELQTRGLGRTIVQAGCDHLRGEGCATIGLETMPRTMDNIGFYSRQGFLPGPLTVTLTLDAAATAGEAAPVLLGRLPAGERDDAVAECAALVAALRPGWDWSREMRLTDALTLGDTVLLHRGSTLVAFALCHSAPLVEGRPREELRILKLAARSDADAEALLPLLGEYARRAGTRRVAIRVQGDATRCYGALVARGARVRWTDLRMALASHPEPAQPADGVLLSNWEI